MQIQITLSAVLTLPSALRILPIYAIQISNNKNHFLTERFYFPTLYLQHHQYHICHATLLRNYCGNVHKLCGERRRRTEPLEDAVVVILQNSHVCALCRFSRPIPLLIIVQIDDWILLTTRSAMCNMHYMASYIFSLS